MLSLILAADYRNTTFKIKCCNKDIQRAHIAFIAYLLIRVLFKNDDLAWVEVDREQLFQAPAPNIKFPLNTYLGIFAETIISTPYV